MRSSYSLWTTRISLSAVIAVVAISSAHAQTSRDILNQARIEPQVGHVLPRDTVFQDFDGQKISLGELTDQRPSVLCLVYFECPMLCKLASDGLVRAAASVPEVVGEDYDVLFVSFDPRDTSQRASAARKNALQKISPDAEGKGWHFLTGSQRSIEEITDAVGFRYYWDAKSKQFSHASGLVMLSKGGMITEYIDGVHFSPQDFSAAIDRAASESLTERESTAFVRCYLYDPATGKFGFAVQWTIRVLGGLTVVTLAVFVVKLNSRSVLGQKEELK